MKITLIAVGSLKTPWAKAGCQQYLDRLSIDLIEVSASKQKDPTKQQEEESASLIKRLEKIEGKIWVLDERGEALTSDTLSKDLEKVGDIGDSVVFVLGGAYGLSDLVRKKADRIIRLSDMVLPHELCRVVLLEQIYRSEQITKGTGYHH
ncbi:MAG: 23S rRNA (pseudouridine(1915)-N(3))-methyltransferase RlmH [Candidatus Peribacter sp.]|jgi:23S rRNA (pseudouridine1915-N3)-methyltransferase|nr:23S rRNA (pseudouridine(1915)-N(3))-methyltransferase RlmH [Candidatus Peribacter sp.]MBT4393321.1 23S rRNA (pseudouridine(1915)-N(3))-methyltransferase RlmH [Candidatus Peribacter sp.]MBT4600947.1 23S rRNA (pseudouridine(1915)-N(3))-methyltransferase RlmH [Candidatus Peribacter sp.]MBT5148824.1 23S rRNA (pseudouridine(1915)-N(3))-methyltransferase RlmH [Candidatus Peribacter sp.]MBT5637908.1 23S rRNA (pseudouridine(1915)-N(3))-methyltransferase RlmH [Candidatus Peribacter sp.]